MKKKKSNEMDCTDGILSPDGILFTNYTAFQSLHGKCTIVQYFLLYQMFHLAVLLYSTL